MSEDYVDGKVRQLIKDLEDHVDSIRIFVNKTSDSNADCISCYTLGKGNFYAQYGQIKEWITFNENKFRHDLSQNEGT